MTEAMFLRCANCGLQFVTPLPANIPVFVDFSNAARELFASLKAGLNIRTILTPSEDIALRWIKRSGRSGSAVLEICFESGRFLEALKRQGYAPFGVDPLSEHTALAREHGFCVNEGLVDSCGPEWPSTGLVVMLESLVRFPDPIAFLSSIKSKFPSASLIVSVPSPNRSLKSPGFDRRSDYPPHYLTRWTRQSLRIAMERAGYNCSVKTAFINANSLDVPAAVRALVRLAYRAIGEAEYSYIALGKPKA